MSFNGDMAGMDLGKLRRDTAAEHAAVEGTVPLMEAGLNREQYVRCLNRIHGVVAIWEERASELAPGWLMSALQARQRGPLLVRDLRWFGAVPLQNECASLPPFADEAELLGAMYVMEGSTLGGQLIARHVEAVLGLEEGQGDAYFRGHGDRTGTMWKEFCEILRSRVPEEQSDAVTRGAKAMFRAFGSWMNGMAQESVESAHAR